jgi:serine/threonine-protein kinase
MVMEYLHGKDLGGVVAERGALGIEESVDYLLQAGEALAEAHALGIVHRDLKPANLFYTQRADGSPCIKVLDFGISKLTGLAGSGSDLGMTKTTSVMGSPLYMSPEQMASSRDVDQGTDIWALGVILYELVTGRVPFEAETMPQLCAMILQQPAPPLRNARPDAPEPLQTVLLRCLEKDPKKRYRNMAEFAGALLPFASRSGRTSVERISRVLGAAGLSSPHVEMPESADSLRAANATQAAWGQTQGPTKGRAPRIVLGIGLVAVGAAAAFFLMRPPSPPEPASQTPAAEANEPTSGMSPTAAPLRPPLPSAAPLPVVGAVEPHVEPILPKPANGGVPAPAAASAIPPRAAAPAPPIRRVPARAPAPRPAAAMPAPAPPKRPVPDLYSDRK